MMSDEAKQSNQDTEALQAENEELKEELERTRSDNHTGRRILVAFLIVLGCITFAFANLANWARDTVFDTDVWVATVGPLSQNPVIVSTLSEAIVEGISEELDLSPPETPGILTTLGILDKPLVEMVQELLSETITTVLLSDEFNEIWVTANEVIHGALVTVLSGDNPYIYAEDGIVYLDINELINEVLNLFGLKELSIFETGDDLARFELMESETLAVIQRVLRFLDRLALLSVIIVILCFGGAIALSKRRRSTIISIGVGAAITMLISLILFNIGEAIAIGSILDPSLYDFANELLNSLTNGLIAQTVLFMILGAVIAAVARFTRPKEGEAAG
jgi:hypothetical protein